MPSSMKKLTLATVCSSNMNRSMEAHHVLAKKGFKVGSFGTGSQIKLPGPTKSQPNCYEFGKATYEDIRADLTAKDKRLYTENGMLNILERNKRIKTKPEKFQECSEEFDVILTCEERVYDAVLENLGETGNRSGNSVHVVNMDIVDNPEDATIGAFLLHELAEMLNKSPDLDDEIDEIVQEFEGKCQRPVLHSVAFY